MFRVGEKVVCICPDEHPRPYGGPKYLEVDVIKAINERFGKFWLILERFGPDVGFQPECFRKLHDDHVERILKQVTKQPVQLR